MPAHGRGTLHTSSEGFADPAGDHAPDYFGKARYERGMKKGHLPVAGVAEFGLGRVFVVCDQNAFGDAWLFYR